LQEEWSLGEIRIARKKDVKFEELNKKLYAHKHEHENNETNHKEVFFYHNFVNV
jgi:hypothetical protein